VSVPAEVAAALDGANDTIVAMATPAGRSAIATVRLSGARALEIAGALLDPWPIAPREARRLTAREPRTGELLDRPVVTVYHAPHSFTGEDIVEIDTHGGAAAPAAVLAALVTAGARPARAGEFTRRAVLHGKLDLAQAEAIGDLIDARSGAMRRSALAQLDGGLSRRVAALRELVLHVEALLAYDIDFPEEDDGPISRARIDRAAGEAGQAIERLRAGATVGELVREGALVVIAGAPNVGKSSLFNALLGRARALVTDVPGTTRDAIEAVIEPADGARPYPLRVVDTAGLRETTDVVERLGIEVSERYLRGAHVVLACGETPLAVTDAVARVAPLTDGAVLPVLTKSDLRVGGGVSGDVDEMLAVSAETGDGLMGVLGAIYDAVGVREIDADVPVIVRERHQLALSRASDEMQQFRGALEADIPATVAAVHLRAAVGALDELIGVVRTDDILDRVFADFCIGK
jgi:tRNA modification GTPase